jgi:hypothetical protein
LVSFDHTVEPLQFALQNVPLLPYWLAMNNNSKTCSRPEMSALKTTGAV